MIGGPADAAAGKLGFYLGGDPETVAQVAPLLETIGDANRFLHCGPDIAHGYTSKLLANTLWFGQVVAVAEMLLLGQRSGLDLDTLHRVLKDSPAGSVFLTQHAGALLAGDYLPSFGIDRVVEELHTVTDLTTNAGTPSDMTRLITRLHEQALERFGPIDGELLVAKLLEEQAGTTLRHPSQPAK
jgi:3-hydroxyisobutyrate dehydrogenase